MVSTVTGVLNSLLAANFSEVGKTPAAYRFPVQNPPIAVVAAEQSDEASLNDKQQKDQQQALTQRQAQNRQQSFSDFARPQLSISPSDETALFATAVAETITPPSITQSSLLSDETNRTRRAVLSQNDREKLSDELLARAQQSVATLYARNNNVVYNVTPVFFEAA